MSKTVRSSGVHDALIDYEWSGAWGAFFSNFRWQNPVFKINSDKKKTSSLEKWGAAPHLKTIARTQEIEEKIEKSAPDIDSTSTVAYA